MSDYAALMREINECLADLVDQTEARKSPELPEPKVPEPKVPQPKEEDNLWLAADAELSAELNATPVPTITRSEISKSVLTDKKGVKWGLVKASGMPGYFVRRLPVLKTAVCGRCNEPIIGVSHQDCITKMSKTVWNSSVYMAPSHRRAQFSQN